MIERLEQRRLLAFTVADGVLTVTGTEDADHIHIRKDGDNLVIVENEVPGTTPVADVTSIVVNGQAGNDRISLAVGPINGIALPATLNGGGRQ